MAAAAPLLTTTTAAAILALLFMSQVATATNILYSNQILPTGGSLTYGTYSFTMQADCNLVLYDRSVPLWSSRTRGRGTGCTLAMQSDGNLVVYTGAPRVAVWSSGTNIGNGNYVCILQSDRNVVIYGGARWNTGT